MFWSITYFPELNCTDEAGHKNLLWLIHWASHNKKKTSSCRKKVILEVLENKTPQSSKRNMKKASKITIYRELAKSINLFFITISLSTYLHHNCELLQSTVSECIQSTKRILNFHVCATLHLKPFNIIFPTYGLLPAFFLPFPSWLHWIIFLADMYSLYISARLSRICSHLFIFEFFELISPGMERRRRRCRDCFVIVLPSSPVGVVVVNEVKIKPPFWFIWQEERDRSDTYTHGKWRKAQSSHVRFVVVREGFSVSVRG